MMGVYFITARENGLVKIGCAVDPKDRLVKLQTCSPAKLRLEATIPGYYEEERELHLRFAEHRVRGEWFTITEELEAIMRASCAPHLVEDERPARPRALSDEELVQESLRLEHETYADCMAWRERMDALDLETPRRDKAA